jgi:hypothetical protein
MPSHLILHVIKRIKGLYSSLRNNFQPHFFFCLVQLPTLYSGSLNANLLPEDILVNLVISITGMYLRGPAFEFQPTDRPTLVTEAYMSSSVLSVR